MSKLFFNLPNGDERTVELRPGEPLGLGRADDNAVRVDDITVSRHHARLVWTDDNACLVEDLDSANGTTLNDVLLNGAESVQDGDRLRFGEVAAIYLAGEADAARLPPVELSAGKIFAKRYRIESSLGATMEYHIFQAEDLALDSRRLFLTIFHPGVISQAGGSERIRREFARIRLATTHPRMIPLLDFGRWRGANYLTTEWVGGFPLLDVLRRRGALTVPETIRLARQVAAATDHARAQGLPLPDLALRAILIAFAQPVAASAWETLRGQPVDQWPTFTLKLSPRLFDPTAPASARAPLPLGALIYELLGHPASASGVLHPARIAGLGEHGNAVLTRWLAANAQGFDDDTSFIHTLGEAAGVVAPRESALEAAADG